MPIAVWWLRVFLTVTLTGVAVAPLFAQVEPAAAEVKNESENIAEQQNETTNQSNEPPKESAAKSVPSVEPEPSNENSNKAEAEVPTETKNNIRNDEEKDDASRSGLPRLRKHSQNNLSLFQGDKVRLKVEAEGEGLLYRWVRNYKTICTEVSCEFDSSSWGLGRQNLTLVVYNRYGSESLGFMIRVLAKPPEHTPTSLLPDDIEPVEVESMSRDDWYVRATQGIGYAYFNREVKVIAQVPRKILWQESIKTHVKGSLLFGKKNLEQHILSPASHVRLFSGDSGQRGLLLMSGSLRSRQLDYAEPGWSILIDDWLQIDGDQKSDVYVERNPKDEGRVRIVVSRGQVSISKKIVQNGSDKQEEEIYVIPAGSSADIRKAGKDTLMNTPPNKSWFDAFKRSSPQYLIRKKKMKLGGLELISKQVKSLKEASVDAAVEQAQKYLDQGDAILALEQLIPLFEKGENEYKFLMLLGNSYRILGLYRLAYRFYAMAGKIDEKSAVPSFEIGRMYVVTRNWKKAIDFLEKSRGLGYSDEQSLHYYLGIARYNLKHKYTARNEFKYSLWNASREDIRQSSESFLTEINDQRWLGAYGDLRFGKDSNVYRWGDGVSRIEGYETESSLYYSGRLDLFVRGYESENGTFRIGFKIEKRYFSESSLNQLGPLTQEIYADWMLNFGAQPGTDPLFFFNMHPYIGLLSLGDERAADSFGVNLKSGLGRLWGAPSIRVDYQTLSDPLPARDDQIDPVLREPVLPSNRSGTLNGYGLGLQFANTATRRVGLDFFIRSMKHSEANVSVDDFSEKGITLDASSIFAHRYRFNLSVGFLTRGFSNSEDARADKATLLDIGASYLVNPSFYIDFKIDYDDQKSNREVSQYKRNDLSLGLSLEI